MAAQTDRAGDFDAEELVFDADFLPVHVDMMVLEVLSELVGEQRRAGATLLVCFRGETVIVPDMPEQTDRIGFATDAAVDVRGIHKGFLSIG